MALEYSRRVWEILACPYCHEPLKRTSKGAKCLGCRQEYIRTASGALDLRLKRKKRCQLQIELGVNLLPVSGFEFRSLRENPFPKVDFAGAEVPYRLTGELISFFPKARFKDSLVLDLGCGDTIHKGLCEHAGFEYVGLDYKSPNAPILGDAHALPFKDNSFEFILSIAVLEHIRFPLLMMSEAYRVVKPAGKFIGTVAFLEPFHGDSFYHHTHLGTFNSLQYAGFAVEAVAPSKKWSVLSAQASMSLFPRMPRPISKVLVLPLHILHEIWWKLAYFFTHSKEASERNRILITTGAFSFIAHKPKCSGIS